MTFSLHKVQEYRKIPGKNEVRLVGENPYVRFVNQEHAAIYIQGGVFYAEGGSVVEPDPWVIEAVCKVRIDKLKRVGLDIEKFESTYNVKVDESVSRPKPAVEEDAETEGLDASKIETPTRRRR